MPVDINADPDAALHTRAGPGKEVTRLRLGSLNLRRLAFIGLAYFTLAPVIYLNMGFIETNSGGPVMPLVFLIITVAIIPTGISFAGRSSIRRWPAVAWPSISSSTEMSSHVRRDALHRIPDAGGRNPEECF
jgi:hypothetical protein